MVDGDCSVSGFYLIHAEEIADVLFASQDMIKTHTSRLFEKLEAKNRIHAIIKAKELGIIVF